MLRSDGSVGIVVGWGGGGGGLWWWGGFLGGCAVGDNTHWRSSSSNHRNEADEGCVVCHGMVHGVRCVCLLSFGAVHIMVVDEAMEVAPSFSSGCILCVGEAGVCMLVCSNALFSFFRH